MKVTLYYQKKPRAQEATIPHFLFFQFDRVWSRPSTPLGRNLGRSHLRNNTKTYVTINQGPISITRTSGSSADGRSSTRGEFQAISERVGRRSKTITLLCKGVGEHAQAFCHPRRVGRHAMWSIEHVVPAHFGSCAYKRCPFASV